MKPATLTFAALLSSLLFSGVLSGRPATAQGPRNGGQAPSANNNEIQRQGFQDGIYGARKDIENGRRPDPNNRDEYRNPGVPPFEREAYRAAFRMGYEQGIKNQTAPPPYGAGPGTGPGPRAVAPPPPSGPGGRSEAPPQEGNSWNGPAPQTRSAFQQMGFDDGLKGARRDHENGRRPDPNNRDEYRSPNVPPRFVSAYREGFRRGYQQGVSTYDGRGRRY